MQRLILVSLFLIIVSCKVQEQDIVGSYKLKHFPKTTLKINSDKTFEFSQNNPNPYLHPYDHEDEYYVDTKGVWQFDGNKTVSLVSQNDTLVYPLAALHVEKAKDNNLSDFKFYDKYNDLVKILYVQYADSSIVASFHKSMESFEEDLTKRDTLEFHFYGYRPYKFFRQEKENRDYNITLKPEFQPGFFKGTKYKWRNKKLIHLNKKVKFKKSNS